MNQRAVFIKNCAIATVQTSAHWMNDEYRCENSFKTLAASNVWTFYNATLPVIFICRGTLAIIVTANQKSLEAIVTPELSYYFVAKRRGKGTTLIERAAKTKLTTNKWDKQVWKELPCAIPFEFFREI